MHPRSLLGGGGIRAAAACAVAAFVGAGLTGCASNFATGQSRGTADHASYVGVFTGEFVDGRPLYRFPTIEVVGSRRSLWHASEPD